MTPWGAPESFYVLVVGKRLAEFLLGITVYCVVAGLVIRYFDLPAVNWGSATALINTVILSLLLSFRNSAAYQRWWEARGLWGKLVNDSRNLAAKCAAFVPAEVLAKSGVKPALVGFADALRRQLRDETPRLNEIAGFENEKDDPAHVPLFLAGRLFDEVAEWKRNGVIDQATLWILDPHLSGLLDVCGGCEKIRNTPLSPSYKGLLRTGLVLNVLAEPWLMVPETGFWALPVFVLVCFFLFGVELIDTIVEEPFGGERDDLDMDRYCATIQSGVTSCLIPKTS
jgi:putative membrane protein